MSSSISTGEIDAMVDADAPIVAMVIRGRVIETDLVTFAGRGNSLTFRAPDPHKYVSQLALSSPSQLAELYELSFDQILDFLEELGGRLSIDRNPYMQLARELTYTTSNMTKPLIDSSFRRIGTLFSRRRVREMADKTIGLDYLNGWVETLLEDRTAIDVRAFGARALHIIPGNGAEAAANAIISAAMTRSDCIIKTPSNNPFAGSAIGRTMCEMDPNHPITRHFAVAYWRGGDEDVERRLLQPHNVEKVVAWGGFASIKHVTRYIQPGLELISLDPKFSGSVIEGKAILSTEGLHEAALRLAVDVGAGNQEPCSAARIVHLLTRDCENGAELAVRLGQRVYDELVRLPSGLSTAPKVYDAELRSNVESTRLQEDFYTVIGGDDDEGCVIVSQCGEPVDFASLLADRTVNIVPVETLPEVLNRFDAYTQTIGVFPESLKDELVDVAPFFGVQRFVSLGYSINHTSCAPHDGLELERRMCKWVINQKYRPIPLAYIESRKLDPEPAEVPMTIEAVHAN
jgi:hypothetical protein